MTRLNAVEQRIQTLLVFAATFTVSAPVLVASFAENLGFSSGWFIAALGVFFANMLVSVSANVIGAIKVLSIQQMYGHWLKLSDREYKERAVWWAGRDFVSNYTLIYNKGMVAPIMTILFGVESFLIVLWVMFDRAAARQSVTHS